MQVDVVKMKNAAPAEYIVAVYGYRNSTFTIQGRSSDDNIVTLDQGLPQGGEVDVDGWRYYSILTLAYSGGLYESSHPHGKGKSNCTQINALVAIASVALTKNALGRVGIQICHSVIQIPTIPSTAPLQYYVDPHQLENSVAYIIGVHGVSAHSEYT